MSQTGEIRVGFDEGDLPPSSYDGSHLPWPAFRQHVLARHHIRIVDTAPRGVLPSTLLAMVESEIPQAARYEAQKAHFRDQVTNGRGFGPSPLFPPNLLPPIDEEPRLARCMVPSFSREALPERASSQVGPLYELSVPRSGLGCGFACSAFTAEELGVLPSWLVCTGTVVHFDTGYISPGAALYCPFLVFERAWGEKQHRLEAANNQCAIGGSWCLRAMQMLFAQAWKEQTKSEFLIAFSCSIDNTFAMLNIHWVDQSQAYCMSPLCKFDLSKDDDFSSFLVWVDLIGKWGLTHLLPWIQSALRCLRIREVAPTSTPRAARLTLDTAAAVGPNEQLITSLKRTFENIPWRFDDDEFTPVSSSTASWGSPMVSDMSYANLSYPIPPLRTVGGTPTSAIQRKHYLTQLGQHTTPPPAYSHNPELIWQKRFNHAMDEIRDLQRQVQALKSDVSTATCSLQNELSNVKAAMDSVLRKETLTLRNRTLSLNMQETTWSTQSSITRSPLANEIHPDVVTDHKTFSPPPRKRSFMNPPSPRLLGPAFQYQHSLPSPGLSSPGLPPSPGMPSPTFSIYSSATTNIITIPPAPPVSSVSVLKFASVMVSGHMISLLIPNVLVRVFVLGCITDVCMLAFASPHLPSSAEYLLSLWKSR